MATPPTVPPTMAPMLLLLGFGGFGVGVGGGVGAAVCVGRTRVGVREGTEACSPKYTATLLSSHPRVGAF
jgi:hypothetical protein